MHLIPVKILDKSEFHNKIYHSRTFTPSWLVMTTVFNMLHGSIYVDLKCESFWIYNGIYGIGKSLK